MKNRISQKKLPQIITIAINLLLLIAIFFLMNYVQGLLKSDSEITLNEVVTQNKNVITSKLTLEMNNVDNIASSLMVKIQGDDVDSVSLLTALNSVVGQDERNKYFVTDKDGNTASFNSDSINIKGRKYFQLSMQGYPNISDKIISRTSGDDVFIISVPLRINGFVIGTVQRYYTVEEMYDLCALSLFSSKGTMNIINKDGYLMLSSKSGGYVAEKDKFYRSLYLQGNNEQSIQLEKGIKGNREGFMEVTMNKEDSYMSYTPIEGIHDWYLITSIAKVAVTPNGSIIIRMFYFILSAIVLVFAFSMFYFIYFKNKQQSNLENLAFVDGITSGNTYTKFALDTNTILSKAHNDNFYILKFDIDNFKYVNNYYGFSFGDKILHTIYHDIHSKLKENETMCRNSSDHFVVLICNDASDSRLKDMFSSIENEEGFQLYYSIGLYEIKDRDESLALMIDKASVASINSKGSLNKKIEVYSEEYNKQMMHNEQMKRAVKAAIASKEIIPYFQPKVDVNSGKVVGAEALARWQKDDGSMVYPDEFIPLSEKSGLIVDIDILIFEDVLKFLRERMDAQLPCVPISVNFSRNHLLDMEFIPRLSKLLNFYQIPSQLIEIEITESAFFNNLNVMNEIISSLHEQGLKISMDDFGAGYSSLNMLKDVAIDVLKIDREFLVGTQNSDKQRIIFTAISKMANDLNIKVVVEGVETQENVEMMKMNGCNIAQGYFYAKPMQQDSFENFITENGSYVEEDN